MRPQFWLWPNLLSLDAPVVALLWQAFFLRCLGAPLNLVPALFLSVTVWLIYVGDRLLDARNGSCATMRHAFYRKHHRGFLYVWLAVFSATALGIVFGLGRGYVAPGAGVMAGVLLYLLVVHALWGGKPRLGFKEAGVAILFALGTSLPAWGWIHTPSDAFTVVLFSALCWLNCVAIEQWESGPSTLPVRIIGSVIAVLGLVLLHRDRPILSSAVAISLFALVFLDAVRLRISRDALRVLADAALLTPLLFLPVMMG